MTRRLSGTAARLVPALLLAGAIGLGGCEQVKSIVGLGGEEQARPPAPKPAGRDPGPPAVPGRRPAPRAQGSPGAQPAGPGARAAGPGAPGGVPGAPGGVPGVQAGAPASKPAVAGAQTGVPGAQPGAPASKPAGVEVGAKLPSVPPLPTTDQAYDPTNKRDPFRPYVTAAELAARKKALGLTPLQRLEMSQLKLVAIVWGARRNHAMVEDPAGVGYVLRVGTKVGPNGGRVSRIAPDAVYIEESFRDASGSVQTNQVVLRLPAPSGGKGS